MMFLLPFEIVGPVLDWALQHISGVALGIVSVGLMVWASIWISGYARRFTQVETDVGIMKTRLDGIDIKLIKMRKKFKAIDTRFDVLEKRMDSFDERLVSLDKKIDLKFDALDQKFTALLTHLSLNKKGGKKR